MDVFFRAEHGLRRRTFLRMAGGTAASAVLVLAGCKGTTPGPAPAATAFQLTANDTGQLNYFYLLQQLQVAFYTQVLAANPSGLQAGELDVLGDLRDHHVVQLRALFYALGNAPLLPQLSYTFTGLTLNTRAGLLAAVQTLEDLTLAALNFSLPLLSSVDTLTLVAKIASAQARHASTVRDLLDPTALAAPAVPEVLSAADGLATATAPTVVLAALAAYFPAVTVDGSRLPVA